ncbi:uncharacterized protein B0H18DRAFT_1055051 [Fomitopsis serialis]|uniref:uncharacterized protein n=1 Tax=Fomitopsis serialis TaxID=139415 RepID=UPI0020087EDD|nr:uncharacterized protein B0H18DRAFT_1055051 [Neoantrodia serialis]KAH9912210.1 hypothetical protein B0H18DRAFT_1055051 [Neoantrodia serialis]
MDGSAAHLPEDAPPAYTEVPIHVDSKPEAPLATAPDGNPVLESEANIVAHTVELPPDGETSADADIGWNKDMGHLPPTIRFYMTVIVSIAGFGKHIARVRSWNEPRRTTGFCVVRIYCVSSLLPATLVRLTGLLRRVVEQPPRRAHLHDLIVLILHPPSASGSSRPRPRRRQRHQRQLQAHKGEAVEQEANNFVSGVGSFALATATGQQDVPTRSSRSRKRRTAVYGRDADPMQIAGATADAKHVAHGARTDGKHDATKKHVESAMWEKARPVMRALADLVDTWERFGNVLTPTAPFSQTPRLRLAALVLPVMIVTTAVPAALFVKGGSFAMGFAMFGQPLITRGIHWLNTNYPNWLQMLEMRRSILKGVPTNAQLTLALLRIAEATHTLSAAAFHEHPDGRPESHPDGAKAEVAEYRQAEHADDAAEQDGKHKTSKLAKIVKGSAKASVNSVIGIDHLKASSVGRGQTTLGASRGPWDGPTTYASRYNGKRGYVVLVTSAATPCVSFVWEKDLSKNLASYAKAVAAKAKGESGEPEAPPAVGGYGWKGKMVIGYALQRAVVDGLGIEDKDGKTHYLTAIKGRDELFNRLIAIGGHKWEQL